jgi:DNA-binding winged helix-turn-helix (wHTH) protein
MVDDFQFGRFRLDRAARQLFRSGRPVALAPKALELLMLLVDNRARTLGKSELLDRLWPDTAVADNNLTVTMSALRKALGETAARPRFLQTLTRRGYRFVDGGLELETSAGLEGAPMPEVSRGRGAVEAEHVHLVGRDAELGQLHEHLQRALAGRGRALFVTGEAGIGKTALCDRFIQSLSAVTPRCTLLRGRSLEQFGGREAYLPWLEAWGELLDGPGGEAARAVLARVAPTWCREFPVAFAGSASPTRELGEISAPRMLREMAGALEQLAATAPVVIVLEDLHWADAASCDLLRLVCQRSQERRWLLLGTVRDVEAGLHNLPLAGLRREALAHGECEELRLAPLARAHVATHLAQRFEPNDFPEALTDALFRRSQGHPLFLTRLASFLVENGDVRRERERWTLGRPLEQLELGVPEDVRGLLRRKLDSLDAEARRALAYASVEGNEFSARVLAALLGVEELDVEERLHPLWRDHRLVEVLGDQEFSDGQPSTRYRFTHVLYQNELYEGLLPRRRARLHRTTAEVLAQHADVEQQRLAATLAVHFERGGDFSSALSYWDSAADNAQRLCAYAEVAQHCTRALALCAHLSEPARTQRSCRLYLAIGWARHNAKDAGGAAAAFEALAEFARAAPQRAPECDELRSFCPEMECEALHGLAALSWFAGRLEQCRRVTEQGLAMARAHGQRRHEVLALVGLTGASAGAGDFEAAQRLAHEVMPSLEELGDSRILACGWVNLGWVGAFQSDFAAAEAAYTRARVLWASLSSSLMCIECDAALGWVHAQRGALGAGLRAFERAAELAQRELLHTQLLRFADGRGWILREIGDLEGALAHDRAGLDQARERGVRFGELCYAIELALDHTAAQAFAPVEGLLARAEALLAAGELEVFPCYVRRAELRWWTAQARYSLARGALERAETAARTLLERAALDPSAEHQVLAGELLAQIAEARGEPRLALERVEHTRPLLERSPMPLLALRLDVVAARSHLRLGELESSERCRARARAGAEQLSAGLIAAQSAQLLSRIAVAAPTSSDGAARA